MTNFYIIWSRSLDSDYAEPTTVHFQNGGLL